MREGPKRWPAPTAAIPVPRRDPAGEGCGIQPGSETGQLLYEEAICLHALGDAAGALMAGTGFSGWMMAWRQAGSRATPARFRSSGWSEALRRLRRAAECHRANSECWAFLAAYAIFAGSGTRRRRIIAGPLRQDLITGALVDGVRAVLAAPVDDFRLFGCGEASAPARA